MRPDMRWGGELKPVDSWWDRLRGTVGRLSLAIRSAHCGLTTVVCRWLQHAAVFNTPAHAAATLSGDRGQCASPRLLVNLSCSLIRPSVRLSVVYFALCLFVRRLSSAKDSPILSRMRSHASCIHRHNCRQVFFLGTVSASTVCGFGHRCTECTSPIAITT